MNKWLTAIAFSVLLLVPLGTQNVSADHLDELTCPDMIETFEGFGAMQGIFVSPTSVDGSSVGWFNDVVGPLGSPFCMIPWDTLDCTAPYTSGQIYFDDAQTQPSPHNWCLATPIPVPHTTLAEQCQGTSFLVGNHCFAQALSSMVGGAWFDINTTSLLVGAIGSNPVITGLFAITMGGIASQAIWFVHRRRKMNKIIPLFAFSILLLAPVGVQVSFADHPDELGCPDHIIFGDSYPGILVDAPGNTYETGVGFAGIFCFVPGEGGVDCYNYDFLDSIVYTAIGNDLLAVFVCTTPAIPVPHITLSEQCQGAAVLIDNHCFAQALSSMIGGELLEINTIPLLVGAIGTNPIITGLVGITIAGIVGQTAWFIHKRKKSENYI